MYPPKNKNFQNKLVIFMLKPLLFKNVKYNFFERYLIYFNRVGKAL